MTENTPDAVRDLLPIWKDDGLGGRIYKAMHAYLDDYVFSPDEGSDHEPNEFERLLLEDFFNGAISDEAVNAILQEAARAMQAAMPEAAGVREDYAAICEELGCIEKPGVPLRFIQEMRKSLTAAGERIDWLLRSWDDATITERQELDRMRRGWGPTTPTERMLRHRDLRDCMQALSGALTDLTTPEDENADPKVEARIQEAYDRVNKRYLASLEILRRLDEPQPRPGLSAIEDAGAWEGAREFIATQDCAIGTMVHDPFTFPHQATVVVGIDWARAADEELCPICAKPLLSDDICATDINEGTCHAACLEGSPVVDLETGEPTGGKADTFLYGDDVSPSEPKGEDP